jgi:hypothetical protein
VECENFIIKSSLNCTFRLIIRVFKTRMRWIGHVVRIEIRRAQTILVGKRVRGRIIFK